MSNLQDYLKSDQHEYSYLFPYRKNIPKIKKHVFSDFKSSKMAPADFVMSKMLDPSYIGWVCKEILNIDLFAEQIAVLQILWKTPFPMLAASRGGSKSFLLAVYATLRALLDNGTKIVIVGAGLRQSRLVFNYIETIWNNAPIFRSIVGSGKRAGPKQNVDRCYFYIGESIITALPLGDGCCRGDTLITYSDSFGTISDDQPSNIQHKNIINRDRKVWGNKNFNKTDESYCNGKKLTKKITTKKGFEFEGTHNHKIKVIRNTKVEWVRLDEIIVGDRVPMDRSWRWHSGQTNVTEDEAYAVGLLIGDGCLTYPDRLSFATADKELVSAVSVLGNFVKVNRSKISYEYYAYGGKKWKQSCLNKFGMKAVLAHEKTIPSTMMQASRKIMSGFLRGLFDSDGGIQEVRPNLKSLGGMIRLTNTSKRLLEQVQFVLLHYGIISSIKLKKGNERSRHQCYVLSLCGKNVKIFYDHIGFGLKRKCDILRKIILEKKEYKDRDDIIPNINGLMSDIANDYDHNLVGKERLAFNTTMCRIRSGKQARSQSHRFLKAFNHISDQKLDVINSLVDDDVYYDQVVTIEDSECVTFDIHVPNTHEYCANGFYSHNSKIRGFRANIVIADEFASINESVFDIVVRGFAATTKSPVDESKRIAFAKDLKQLDLPANVIETFLNMDHKDGNQIIYSGTAFYAFNHFAKNYEKYKAMIQTKGDPYKVAKIFGGPGLIPDNFSYKDYAIIRIPYTHLPAGLLEPKQLAHAKALLPKNIFQMEYGACATEDLLIDTSVGIKKIIDINNGDLVLSHNNRYRKVISRKYRYYNDLMIQLRVGLDDPINVTKDHLLWNGNSFVKTCDINVGDKITYSKYNFIKDHSFDLKSICRATRDQIINNNIFIYPKPSQSIHQNRLLSSIKYYKPNTKFKSSIPRHVSSSFGLGYILGLYAGDCSLNRSNKNQLEFSLNINQNDIAQKVSKYIYDIFGLTTHKIPCKKDNTLRVQVNSGLVCDFIKHMMGCGVLDKRIYHMNLYTKNMANGFIAGYFDSDGKLDICTPNISSANLNLLKDMQRLLLNLKCYSGVKFKEEVHEQIIKGHICHCKDSYLLQVPSEFKNKLLQIINNKTINTQINISITHKEYYDYSGYVYNLEVDEDHSYFAQGICHHNCFIKDSDGFFPRSLIESCTTSPSIPLPTPDGPASFTVMMRGEKGRKYVVGIDPAAERDNLAIVVIEVWANHSRIVHCWAVNKPDFLQRKKNDSTIKGDYYDYCCKKIREVVRLFKPVRVEMDSQGGGYAISEMLRDKRLIEPGDFLIYECIDHDDPKETDSATDGRHILNLVKQSNQFNEEANIALHKSFGTKRLLFSAFDAVEFQAALAAEKKHGIYFDTYEDCLSNIEELKNELCTIQRGETATGKGRFDTPKVGMPSIEGIEKKGRLRKDRYTALLLGHKYVYDNDIRPEVDIDYKDVVGNIKKVSQTKPDEGMYQGPGVGGMKNANDWARGKGGFSAIKRGKRL